MLRIFSVNKCQTNVNKCRKKNLLYLPMPLQEAYFKTNKTHIKLIFCFHRRTADVRSVGYSELFVLSREDVLSALKDHPEAEV